ncbi:MAG: efflux RND transporter periplasmic adaptor subunit [Deltaproteobacteria bacterium]|nr:MAG: efflux RND transporter periplasmic adaptor subunit [Deltaproteobacteria bacterium]
MLKRFLVLAATVLLAAGCVRADRETPEPRQDSTPEEGTGTSAGSAERAERHTPVRAWTVRTAVLPRIVLATGTVEPRERVRVAARQSGSLLSLDVQEGDAVSRGQTLAQVDTAQMRAELRRARAEEALLAGRIERMQALVDRGAAPPVELADLEAQREVASAEVDVWRARMDLARVRAPMDGVVLRRMVDPGSTVRADQELLELADLSGLMVRVRLSERDVVHLVEGQRATIVLDAFADAPFGATVHRIFPAVDPEDRRLVVELALGTPPEGVHPRPGFMARIGLALDARPMRIIPGEALLASTRGERFVYVIEDDRLTRRDVETGVERRNWVEVREGLDAGETVVGMNPSALREGLRVRVTARVEPPNLSSSEAAAMRAHGLDPGSPDAPGRTLGREAPRRQEGEAGRDLGPEAGEARRDEGEPAPGSDR